MDLTLKDRLYAFIDNLGITVAAFERSIGASNGFVSSVKERVGAQKLASILKVYPQLSPTWLVMGVGNMLIDSDNPGYQTSYSQVSFENSLSHFDQTYNLLLKEIKTKDEQIDRLIKLLEHIVYQGGTGDFQSLEISPKSRQ